MKTYKKLYEQIYDFENLYRAYREAKKHKMTRDEVLVFTANLEEELHEIQNELIYQTYKVGAYEPRYIYDKKKRLIMALPFKDRVVQWAIYRVVNPIYTKSYIFDSYGCIKGKGPQKAAKRAQYWMKLLEHRNNGEAYYLKTDISKFFYRVDQHILLDILGRKIADDRLMWLFRLIIQSEDQPFGLPQGYNPGETGLIFHKGMPIGNLISQMLANIYMNELDQYAKRDLCIEFLIRYIDDTVIFAENKEILNEYKDLIRIFLEERLGLNLNNKTVIRPTYLGLDFCGYKTWSTHMKFRKSTALRMKRRLKVVQRRYAAGKMSLDKAKSVLTSYQGMVKHCDSYNLRCTIFGDREKDSPGWFSLKRNTPDEAAPE